MGWIDNLSRRIGEKTVKKKFEKEIGDSIPGIKQEIDILEELRLELVRKDEELEKTRLEWDRTFDSIIDDIVLIDRNMNITKANNAFYDHIEKEIGHIEFIGMNWYDFKDITKIPIDNCPVTKCYETGLHQESIVPIRGKILNVIANPVYTKTSTGKEIIGIVRVSRDITDSEKVKKTIERRASIYKSISEMSKTLVNHQDWRYAMNLILGDLGRSIGASRVYIFKNEIRDDRICSIKQHVFHNKHYRDCGSGDLVECINYELVPDWKSKMEHGLSVEGELVECNLCKHKNKCYCFGNVIVCAVPIFVDRKWWGFIGFDYMNGTRVWKDDDATLLRISADILGGVIYHRERYWETVNELEGYEDG